MNTPSIVGRWCLLLLLSSMSMAWSSPLSAAAPMVAVAPPVVSPVADRVAVAADLVAAVAAVSSVRALSTTETASMFARAATAGIDCDARQAPCAARVAAFAGVDFMVVADVSEATASVELVDGRDGRVLRRRQAPLQPGKRPSGLGALVRGVLLDAPVLGRLRVNGPAGAVVHVDGAVLGEAPIEHDVEAGPHSLNGSPVLVPAGGTLVVERLADAPGVATEGFATAAIVTTVSGAALGLAGGIGAVIIAPAREQRSTLTASAGNNAVTTGRGLLVVAGVGVGLVVVGTGMWVAVGSSGDDTDTDSPAAAPAESLR